MNQAQTTPRTYEILLVEDSPGDVRLCEEALRESARPPRLHVVRDGVEAMEFLRKPEQALPDLILLDLNLPRKDGRQVLRELKQDARLRRIPVVVLSTSSADKDIRDCYDLLANCFITKPADLGDFLVAVRAIQEFWFGAARLPAR